jgi:hypothetical protein
MSKTKLNEKIVKESSLFFILHYFLNNFLYKYSTLIFVTMTNLYIIVILMAQICGYNMPVVQFFI